jgi:MoxR-like ATPase
MAFNANPIIEQISQVVLGKKDQVRLALTCLFAGGHLLIEDRPGIGKTTLAQALAQCLGLRFRRLQFTSDMLPGDILGVSVFERESNSFVFHPGPIFTQVLLADEINRTTPKTQSALLEAMEERQVSSEGTTRSLEQPFFVIATQNPLELAGTFPLPESQLDRFLMRIELGYPDRAAERAILLREGGKDLLADLACSLTVEDSLAVMRQVATVRIAGPLVEYIQDILDFSRTSGHFQVGLSPRAGLQLMAATRAAALLAGRDYAVPADVQQVLLPVVAHRLRSAGELAEIPRDRLATLFNEVAVE